MTGIRWFLLRRPPVVRAPGAATIALLLLVGLVVAAGSPLPAAGTDDLLIELPRGMPLTATSPIDLVNQGARLLAAGATASAEALLGQAVVANPGSAEAAYNFGLALAFNGRHVEAMQAQFKALELRPAFPEAHLAVGVLYLTAGKPAEALAAFERAAALDPADAVKHAVVYNRGVALGRLGRHLEAELALSEALVLAPEDPAPALELGRVQMRQGRWQEAVDWLEATIVALPLESHSLRARAWLELNQPERAAESIRLAAAAVEKAGLPDEVRARVRAHLQALEQRLPPQR